MSGPSAAKTRYSTNEAVDLYRRLATARPDASNPTSPLR
jgi:hypothetical protein